MSARDVRAPLLARKVLSLSLPRGTLRDSILGDFSEEHRRRARDDSITRARLWYWRHALDLALRSITGRIATRDRYWVSLRRRLDADLGTPATLDSDRPESGRSAIGSGDGDAPKPRRRVGSMLAADTLVQDLRFGLRQIVRRPGFSALVALTLAVGIGGNVAIFSVLKGVVLRQPPFPEPERLVAVWETPEQGRNYQPFSTPDYLDVRDQVTKLEEIGVTTGRWFNLAAGGEPTRVQGAVCTASLLRLLGVSPEHGRLFSEEEETEGNERVLVLSHGFWQRHFGGDAEVIGSSVIADGQPYEVVGVMPVSFEFPTPWGGRDDSELWAPLVLSRQDDTRGSHWLGGIARLAPGVTAAEAEVELEGIAARLAEAYPDTNGHTGMWIEPMMRRTLGGIAAVLVFLLFIVGLVLLIACANVASMLLARGTHRLPELAVRASMGAGRRRLVRQLMTESLMLSLLGGAAGVLLAYWGVGALRGMLPDSVPRVSGIAVDTSVMAFAAFMTIATGLLFGLAPALFAARSDLAGVLKESPVGGRAGGGGNKLLAFLVAGQLAIGLVLVNAAVVLLVSYANVMRQDLNFRTGEVMVAGVSLVGPAYEEPHQRRAFWGDVLQRIRGFPEVVDAGLTSKLPLRGGSNGGVLVNDDLFDPTTQDNLVEYSFIADGYHEAMGITLLGGRTLTAADLEAAAAVAGQEDAVAELPIVVNRTMAERFWPEDGALGKLVRPYSAVEHYRARVVGVVEDTRQWGPEYPVLPEMYFPHTAELWGPSSNRWLIVHAEGDPDAAAAAIRAAVLEVDEQIPVSAPYTMEEVLRQGTGRRRFSLMLVGLFAGTALLLIVAGTYGVMSFAVSQRTHEIGVRVALGADRAGVFRLFMARAARMLLPGLLFGLAGTVAAAAITRSMVFGISPLNPLYVLAAAGVMLVVTFAATIVPVTRAMRVDPVEALRAE